MVKILIGILCIDRDYKYLSNLFNFINQNNSKNYKCVLYVT
jgi:hypothetical protein